MTTSTYTKNSTPNFSDQSRWNQLSTCPLCRNADLRIAIKARDRHYGNPGLFAVAKCSKCGLNFLNPMPTLSYLSGAYPMDYYSYAQVNPETDKSSLKKQIKKALRTVLSFHHSLTGDPEFTIPGTMLDFGCGSGSFLAQMRDKGWGVHGLELDVVAAERGRKKGLNIFGGTIEEARFSSESFDYVRSNHSFEHIHNPQEVLFELRRILKPTGLLFIGVPNISGLMARLYGKYWWYLGAPVHPFSYNPSTLGRMLSESGFKVEKVKYNSSFPGVFGSLQLYLNRNNGRLGAEGWICHNRVLMVVGYWVARTLDFFRMGDCIEIIAKPVH